MEKNRVQIGSTTDQSGWNEGWSEMGTRKRGWSENGTLTKKKMTRAATRTPTD